MYNVCHSQLVNDSGGGGGKTKATHYSFRGSFKNYVDKIRWVGAMVHKITIFVHVQSGKWPRRGQRWLIRAKISLHVVIE